MLAYSPLPISRPCNSPWRWEKDTKNLLPPDFISPSRPKPFSQNREHVGLHLALVKGEVKQSAVAKLPKTESNSSPLSTFQDTDAQNLKQLIQSKRLDDAKILYVEMKRKCLEPGIVLESVLIDACMKSGRFSDAFWVFEEMPERNVVTWTSMISGCVRNNQPGKGFSLFVDMIESGFLPNDFSLNAALQACADLEALDHGRQVHSLIVRSGLENDSRTSNCLIHFYSKCRLMDKALLVSDALLEPDLVTFTSLITGFCKNNMLESAIRVFDQLVRWGLEPNQHTITSVLSACDPPLGEQIHGYMIKTKLDQSLYSSTSLIEFYSKNNAIEEAKLIFSNLKARSVVTWSSMISCCLRNEQVDDALKLFYEMFQSGIKHNEFTLASGIRACGLCAEQIGLGRQLHCSIIKLYLESDDHIINALLTMYARNGEIEEFEKVFKKIRDPDVVSWCAAISGYFQNGFYEKSTNLLCQMHRKGYTPNEYGFSSAISSSANLSLLDQGRQFHCFALKLGCDNYLCTGNALVNMYAKCGCVNDARLTFDIMPTLDLMSWNSLIYGYANFGNGREALEIFDQMVEINCMTPDQSTFVGLLVACNHMGFVDEGLMFFEIMQSQYGITPSAAHYACIVDMMGRSERFPEAVEIISKMPFEPDTMMWKTLLGSCKLHKNLELGKLIAERVIQFSPEDSSSYVLLSNLHAMHGEWVDADRVRKLMEDRGVKKDAAWSWIECKNIVHAFVARDESHPRAEDIYKKLEELMKVMTEEGYSPDLSFVTDDL